MGVRRPIGYTVGAMEQESTSMLEWWLQKRSPDSPIEARILTLEKLIPERPVSIQDGNYLEHVRSKSDLIKGLMQEDPFFDQMRVIVKYNPSGIAIFDGDCNYLLVTDPKLFSDFVANINNNRSESNS